MKIRITVFISAVMMATAISAQNQQRPGEKPPTQSGNAATYCSGSKGSPEIGYNYENRNSNGIKGTAGMTTFGNSVQVNESIKISDYIGINSNVAAYDQRYLSDLAKCTKWIREYHSWSHYEAANDYYKWDNITKEPQGYTWPHHTKFMEECRRLGINVLIDVLNKPSWAGEARGAYHTGDGSQPEHYLERLEFIGQLVARYGAQKVDDSLLETADKVSGLGYIKYYEDDNEPDYWWEDPLWPAHKYAVYCNAVHDGYGVETSEDYPLLGIKSVDSTAVHVLAGLAKETPGYIQKILNNSDGRIPFDIINIHTYCTDKTDGYSPENENYGLEKKLGGFMDWCERTLPELPVWITEFGWDTYIENGQHSYVYAPHEQQANYIMRSYFITLEMGFQKAFLFMDKDPNSDGTLQYSSSGIITDKDHGLSKKPSYYYLATMQNVLGEAVYHSTVSYGEPVGNKEVYSFKFRKENETVYALWTREKMSDTDNGSVLPYHLQLDYQPEYVYSVLPRDNDMDGDTLVYEPEGTSIDLILTETPQFVVVSENGTSSLQKRKKDLDFKIYPNPSDDGIHIALHNRNEQEIKVSLYSTEGKLLKVLANQVFGTGNNYLSFNENLAQGMYMVSVHSANYRKVEKVFVR